MIRAPRRRGPAAPLPRARRRGRRTSPSTACTGRSRDDASRPRAIPRVRADGAELADRIAGYAADKQGDRRRRARPARRLGYTDFFVICSGNTDRQTKAIHDGIHLGMKKDHGLLPRRVEGLLARRAGSSWTTSTSSSTSSRPRRATSTASSSSGARRRGARSSRGQLKPNRGRPCGRPRYCQMELRGLEPLTFWLPARRSPS